MLYAAGMIGVRWMQVLWRKTAVWCLVFSCDDRVVVALLRLKERLAMAVLKLPEGGNHALGISLMYQVPLWVALLWMVNGGSWLIQSSSTWSIFGNGSGECVFWFAKNCDGAFTVNFTNGFGIFPVVCVGCNTDDDCVGTFGCGVILEGPWGRFSAQLKICVTSNRRFSDSSRAAKNWCWVLGFCSGVIGARVDCKAGGDSADDLGWLVVEDERRSTFSGTIDMM